MAREAIFIGYRRDDTADVAGRIYDAMALRFGRERIFKDVDNIGPGVHFGEYVRGVLPRCRVALILIGPNWVDSAEESGQRRIDDEHDWVRIEIETALATPNLLTVPVLVNGARMPRADELPEALRPLLHRNAAVIRRDPDFHDDVERLATALRASVNSGVLDLSKIGGQADPTGRTPTRRGANRTLLAIIAMAALLAAGYAAWRYLPINFAAPGEQQAGEQQTANNEAKPPGEDAEVAPPQAQPPAQAETRAPGPEQALAPAETRPPAPQPAPQQASRVFRDCADCPEMVRIPGQSFAAGRYEVTFAEWDACVADGGCNGYRPNDQGWGRGNRPVINVSRNDAQAYLRWLSQRTGNRYRLLTSAEWEYAARAGTTTTFWWGDQAPVCDLGARNGAQTGNCRPLQTLPVGSFQPNAYGLYDVHGNAYEWVEDCEVSRCYTYVLRGGNWFASPLNLGRDRIGFPPDDRHTLRPGFRVARTN